VLPLGDSSRFSQGISGFIGQVTHGLSPPDIIRRGLPPDPEPPAVDPTAADLRRDIDKIVREQFKQP